MRDYDALLQDRPTSTLPAVSEAGGQRRVSFQLWKWADNLKTYELELLMFIQKGGAWEVKCRKGLYRALKRAELEAAMVGAGFTDIEWHLPSASGYYQPIVTAKKG